MNAIPPDQLPELLEALDAFLEAAVSLGRGAENVRDGTDELATAIEATARAVEATGRKVPRRAFMAARTLRTSSAAVAHHSAQFRKAVEDVRRWAEGLAR